MSETVILMDTEAVRRAITRIAHEIAEHNHVSSEVVVIGIQRGGIECAQLVSTALGKIWQQPVPIGSLDVSMHRDDISGRISPDIHPTIIPFDVTGKTVVLVDDVLFSGRTVRAAMDSLNDFGRPRRIQLAVLIDRGHRELPIKADFVGKNVPTALGEKIIVNLGEEDSTDAVILERP